MRRHRGAVRGPAAASAHAPPPPRPPPPPRLSTLPPRGIGRCGRRTAGKHQIHPVHTFGIRNNDSLRPCCQDPSETTSTGSGSAGDVLDDDPDGKLKVFIYDLPGKYNKKLLKKDPRCLNHMFDAEIFMHRFLLSSAVRTSNPEEADWFYTPMYPTCDLKPSGLPLPFKFPRMMRSASELIARK
ncbi:hypothetical protein QYE76_006350 [Lolium multiflorum]|uniref:Exostosin GT47 domain-containing protein n=1 Tax=Lolium multiflorum TaxID=4521 RepID=A0AAD8RVH2_LOLMU|nr:hypothetical protein QYE76_006350 [Lolium multiflorum]